MKRVLVTGARGLLGAEVIRRLLALGHPVIALLRTDGPISPIGQEALPTVPFHASRFRSGEVQVVHGDVAEELLGLGPDLHEAVRASTDLIVHCAAITSFGLSPEKYEATNTRGTVRMLELAKGRKKAPIPFVYVSTAYVAGERPGTFREEDLELGQQHGNPYEQSKFKAEQQVRAAIREGLPAVVARPGIIVGHSETGVIPKFDTLYTVIRLTSAGLVRTLPGDYGATLDIVPVDWVADGVVAAVESFEKTVGRTLHLVSDAPVTLKDINGVCAEFPSFLVPRYVPRHLFDVNALGSVERRYYREVISLYESYFWRKVRFARESTRETFPAAPYSSGPALLRTAFRHALKAGYFGRDGRHAAR